MKRVRKTDEFVELLTEHSAIFGYHYMPDREIIINEDKLDNCMELYRKSIAEKVDYIAMEFNIDVEQETRHYDGTID